MAMLERQIGSTSEIVAVFVPNATVSTGAGLANVSASSLSISWWRSDMTSTSTYTAVAGTLGTWGASTIAQVNSTFALGWYQVSAPNGVFVAGDMALMHLYGYPNMAPVPVLFDITRDDPQQYVSSKVYSSTNIVLGVTNPVGVSTIAVGEKLVGVSTIAVSQKLVGVSSASVDFGVSTIAAAQKLVGVSTIAVGEKLVGVSTIAAAQKLVGVSTITAGGLTNFFDTGAVFFSTAVVSSVVYEIATNAGGGGLVGVSSITTPVGVSTLSVPVGVSSYSRNAGVSTVAVLVGVSTLAVPVGVSSASVDFGVSTIAVAQKLVGVSTMASPVGVSSSIMVSSNTVQINNVTLTGDGSATPWGPA